jgi:hypothetical protein
MPAVLELSYPHAEPEEPAYLFAQDALAAALRYVFAAAGERQLEALRAQTAIEVAWDVAPAAPHGHAPAEDIDRMLSRPVERWLPFADALGVKGVRLTEDGAPSVAGRLLAKSLLPYLFGPVRSELQAG